jgi:hypothetical protein
MPSFLHFPGVLSRGILASKSGVGVHSGSASNVCPRGGGGLKELSGKKILLLGSIKRALVIRFIYLKK